MSNVKIVTSIYELNHEEERGGMVYKNFPLTSLTIRNIIFEKYKYVIYTDKFTFEKHDMGKLFDYPNVEIKFQELNQDFYIKDINPIREKKYKDGDIWERFYSVKNYIEVILNKFKHLIEEAEDGDNTFWLDAGLFGTSCSDGWRDYMVEIAHTENFIEKINEKINIYDFICLRGNDIQMNCEVRDRLFKLFNVDIETVPGCLFGGKKDKILEVLCDYINTYKKYSETYQELVSEQEILSVLTHKSNVKFYDFDDWLDLQKAFLNIMDVYDEKKYIKNSCELYSIKYLDRYQR
jgi:hypothetical protein